MTSLKALAATTDSYLVLIAIEHAIAGYTRANAGCMDKIPADFTVDLTKAELMPHYKRVNDAKVKQRDAGIEREKKTDIFRKIIAASHFTGIIVNR